MENNDNNVFHASSLVQAMHGKGGVIRALLGGTDAMRAAGKTYLPK